MLKKILHYFSFVMSIFYLGIGLLFLFTDILINIFPSNRFPLGCVFTLYALIRIFTAIRKLFFTQSEEE